MSATEVCDLCGLKLGAQVWAVRHEGREVRFCCEGCKGIWQMLNNVDDESVANSAGKRKKKKGARS